jgi:hypothetical protein
MSPNASQMPPKCLPDASQMPPSSPLFYDVSSVAPTGKHTKFQLRVFFVLENQVRNSCNILSKMESKRVPKFGRMWERQVWNHTKNRFGTYVHANDKISTHKCSLRFDFDAPSCTESPFSLFQICPTSAKLGGQKPPKLNPMGASGSTKMKGERFRKHQKHVTTKVSTNVTNMLQKEGPQKWLFEVF